MNSKDWIANHSVEEGVAGERDDCPTVAEPTETPEKKTPCLDVWKPSKYDVLRLTSMTPSFLAILHL